MEKENIHIKERIRNILSIANSDFIDENKSDDKAWAIYHGKQDTRKFKYLTDVEGFTYPAKLRNIGSQLVRSKLNLLESKQARREFKFKAIAHDERSLQEKVFNQVHAYIQAVSQSYEERTIAIQFQIQQVSDRLADYQRQLELQPESEEQAMQLQQLRANYPMINYEFQKIIRALQREEIDSNEINKKMKYFLENSEQEIIQQIANASLRSAIQTEDLTDHWNAGLRERLVTGKPNYLVYYNSRKDKMVFKQVDSKSVKYSRGGNNKWIQEGEYCVYKEHMDLMQLNMEFNLTESEYKLLKAYEVGDSAYITNTIGNTAYFDVNDNLFSGHDKIEVNHVWVNVPREEYYRISPNKHRPGENFYNITTKDGKLKSNEKREKIVIYDQYYYVVIGSILMIDMGRNNHVFRPKDMPGLPYLPIVGRAYNRVSEKPYSVVLRVEDIIDMYDVVNYKKELVTALAGVKGMIMDRSQKPDNMTLDRWMYYRRLGTMWIETVKKGRKVPATFNQFQNYDDGISESIQWFEVMQQNLEMLMSKIMGITPSAEGQFVSKDPVNNVKMSNEQSSLITEIHFFENDKIFTKALELFLNLKAQFEWDKGKVVNYLDPELEEVLVRIPANMLKKADFRLFTSNNIKQDMLMDDIKQIAVQSWGRQELPLNGLISLLKIDDIDTLEKKFIQITKDAEMLKMQQSQNIEESRERAKQETAKLQAQIDMEIEQFKSQMEAAKLELDKAQFEFDVKKWQIEQDYKEREMQAKVNTDVFKIASENEIESAYLEEEGRANRVQEMLKSFELKINAILNEMQIKSGDVQNLRKTQVDMKNMRNKNNIKD